jgi:hypothetical protein
MNAERTTRPLDAKSMYLDYFNNFLTTRAFAEYYGLTDTGAIRIIDKGRKDYLQHITRSLMDEDVVYTTK